VQISFFGKEDLRLTRTVPTEMSSVTTIGHVQANEVSLMMH
jgi:hypothetical protein